MLHTCVKKIWCDGSVEIFLGTKQGIKVSRSLKKDVLIFTRIKRIICVLLSGHKLYQGKSPVYTLQLSQKSDFQPSNMKPDNIGHPTANLAPGVVSKVVFHFVRIKNIQFYTKKFISNSF